VIGTYGANIKENESFFYFSEEFNKKKLAIPEIFAISNDRMFYLQEDFGDISLLNRLEARALLKKYILFLKKP
jgi:predicted adenine nucleotide alpha hydrolase (AANH) superfamily ATPase